MAEGRASEAPKALSVAELTARVRLLLERNVGRVWVEGECSNVSAPNSGHVYFTLKDERSQIQAAWFKGRRAAGALLPRDGMQLRVYGLVTAYERGAQIQILVEQAEDAGAGDLQRRFEALKAKLQAEGLFERSRKRPLPLLPRRIGVVTSPTGAAIRDILQVLTRRYPDREVLLAPVPVQGEGAAQSIARAISYLDTQGGVDVMIVGRGGGSLEDLWCFNEEVVARAVAASRTPILSAVGHEIDFTICDFVADVRAPTPSAAAELVIGRKADFEAQLRRQSQRLTGSLLQMRLRYAHRLERARGHRLFHEPRFLVEAQGQRVAQLGQRMRQALTRRAAEPQRQLSEAKLSLQYLLERRLRETQRHVDELEAARLRALTQQVKSWRKEVEALGQQLHALSPYQVLRRGFSITRIAGGGVMESLETLTPGTVLETLTREGKVKSRVESVERTGGAREGGVS